MDHDSSSLLCDLISEYTHLDTYFPQQRVKPGENIPYVHFSEDEVADTFPEYEEADILFFAEKCCLGHLLWASELRFTRFGFGKMGTANPIVVFYGIVFGQIQQAQIHILILPSTSLYLRPKSDGAGKQSYLLFVFDLT